MAERRLRALRNNRQLARYVLEGRATGKQQGTGSYGSVEEIEVNGLVCAGKKIHEVLIDADNAGIENVTRVYVQECQLMSDLRHPNITQFLGVCFLPNCQLPVLLMERLDGSLDELLETVPNIPLALKRSILESVSRGLLYLHKHTPQIIHRDLTAKNVLLTSYFVAKITDFGNSRIVNLQPGQLARTLSRLPGTLVYMPPEALSSSSRYGPSLDVFSFGHLTLFTLLQVFPGDLQEPNYADPDSPGRLLGRSEVERRQPYFDQLEGRALVGLIKTCLHNDPSRRPTVEQLVTALEEVKGDIEGPCRELTTMDAARQVRTAMALKKEKLNQLAAKDQEIQQLQHQLEVLQAADERREAELYQKDEEIRQKNTQLEILQAADERREAELHQKDEEIRQKSTQLEQAEMTQLQQTHRAELQQKDIQHTRAVHQLEERQRQREEEVREELQQKEVLLQQKNSDISRLQSEIERLQVDLHKSEHRWVRRNGKDRETEELFRKFQGILNKLTPQKFQNLAKQVLQLKIDNEERLEGCIDKIFTSALAEPIFSIVYANLSKVMSTIKVEVPTEPEEKPKVITFRCVLFSKMQQEFEKDKREDEERENMLNAIKETEDSEKRKQLEDDLEACEVKNRKRSLNNIRFIGELFKLKMLSETIMHECVVRLLRSSYDGESLECFAGLITTVGKDLDRPEAKTRIDQYFTRIAEIIKKGKVPARTKFMLQDVQELRWNNWVPRQSQEQSLEYIDQIYHEAIVEEEKEKQFVTQAFASGMKHGGGSRRGSTKHDNWPRGTGGKADRDRNRRDKDRYQYRERDRDRDRDKPKEKLDARKLQLLLKYREKKGLGAPTLGPGSGLQPQGWGRGGTGAQDSTETDKDKRQGHSQNLKGAVDPAH